MRKVAHYLLAVTVLLASTAYAGGIDNKQNLSTKYISTGSRNAATSGSDIATYNPAGTTKLEDGLYLQLDAQYILKDYSQTVGVDELDQDEPSVLPTFFAVYKKDNWAAFGSFTVNGGGGKVEYEDGNIITTSIGAALTNPMGPFGYTGIDNEYIMAESYYYTYTLGGAYAVNDNFSFALAGRYISATKEIKATADLTGGAAPGLCVNYDQEADGFGYVVGINYSPNQKINLAMRYESEVELDFDTSILPATDAMGSVILGNMLHLANGDSPSRNLPAVLGMGAEWKATDDLTLSTSFTLYLEKDADWDGEESDVDHNSYDLGISAEYAFTPKFSASLGYMYTDVGLEPADFDMIENMSPALDNHAVMIGAEYKYSDSLTITSGIMCNYYVADGTPAVEYDKTNYVFAMGFQYKVL